MIQKLAIRKRKNYEKNASIFSIQKQLRLIRKIKTLKSGRHVSILLVIVSHGTNIITRVLNLQLKNYLNTSKHLTLKVLNY